MLSKNLTPQQQNKVSGVMRGVDPALQVLNQSNWMVMGNLVITDSMNTVTDFEYAAGSQPYPSIGVGYSSTTGQPLGLAAMFQSHVAQAMNHLARQRANDVRRGRVIAQQ